MTAIFIFINNYRYERFIKTYADFFKLANDPLIQGTVVEKMIRSVVREDVFLSEYNNTGITMKGFINVVETLIDKIDGQSASAVPVARESARPVITEHGATAPDRTKQVMNRLTDLPPTQLLLAQGHLSTKRTKKSNSKNETTCVWIMNTLGNWTKSCRVRKQSREDSL